MSSGAAAWKWKETLEMRSRGALVASCAARAKVKRNSATNTGGRLLISSGVPLLPTRKIVTKAAMMPPSTWGPQ